MNKTKFLLTYRYALIIHDLTILFTKYYLLGSISRGNLSNLGSRPDYRQADQMNQASRSGKQNIIEGVGQSYTSTKGEMKLLGVAKASFDELLTDYEDFLRQNNRRIYHKSAPIITSYKEIAYRLTNINNLTDLGDLLEKPKLFLNPEQDGNLLLTLCHIETYLLDCQIKALEDKFIKEGGRSENLFRKRLEYRNQ